MALKVDYYPQDDILRISTGHKAMDGATLWDAVNVEVDIGTYGGHDIVGFSVLSASGSVCPYFVPAHTKQPQQTGQGNPGASYDEETDTLTLGVSVSNPSHRTADDAYITGHWKPDEADGNAYWDIIGVSLKEASRHLAPHFRLRIANRELGELGLIEMGINNNWDSFESGFRERTLEYIFLSEILQEVWLTQNRRTVDVLRPDVDRAGYDLVLECEGISRYIQLKSSRLDARTSRQTLNAKLADKPGGCVIWLSYEVIDGRAKLHYRFFGGTPEEKPNLGSIIGKHSKGNAEGVKAERPNTRVINKGGFTQLSSVGELIAKLFPSSNS